MKKIIFVFVFVSMLCILTSCNLADDDAVHVVVMEIIHVVRQFFCRFR